MSGWLISGRILATFISGSGFTDSEWLFNQVRVRDLNSTSTFITWDPSSTATSWSGNVDCRFVKCRGNGVTVYDATKCPNFHIFEIINSTFINLLYCNKLGKIIDSTFWSSSGVTFNTLTGLGSSYMPYYSEMINTTCQSGSIFKALTTGQTLYVDNATWTKSNKSISVDANGYLPLNIEPGFPSPITITTPSTHRILA